MVEYLLPFFPKFQDFGWDHGLSVSHILRHFPAAEPFETPASALKGHGISMRFGVQLVEVLSIMWKIGPFRVRCFILIIHKDNLGCEMCPMNSNLGYHGYFGGLTTWIADVIAIFLEK